MKKTITILLVFALTFSFSGCIFTTSSSVEDKERIHLHNTIPAVFSEGNPYAVYYEKFDGYILPDSCSEYLSWSDLSELSSQELFLAKQEIYARYGQRFDDPDLNEYFCAQTWYQPQSEDVTAALSGCASINLFCLDVHIAMQDNSIRNWDNPYLALVTDDYLLPDSSKRELTANDLQSLSSDALTIARNEIFARHGYIFSDRDLRAYFYTKAWYRPSAVSSDFDYGCLSTIEAANVELIQQYEENAPSTNTGGNTGTTGGVPGGITVVDKYTYLLEKNCYHIPYVELPAAAAVNQEMYDDCYALLQKHVFEYPDQPLLYRMQYTVGRYGDVVSVMVFAYQDWGSHLILVYNFSASTGRKLSDSQVFGAYGLSEMGGRNKIRTALEAYWESQFANASGEYADYAQSCKEKTLTDSNVASWTPYIDAGGNLCFTGTIYSLAGAESYEHLLDQSGDNLSGPGCSIHG